MPCSGRRKYMYFMLAMLFCLSMNAQAVIIIDEFSTSQVIPADSTGSVNGLNMIGGSRDVRVRYLATADINTSANDQLLYNSGGALNFIYLEYDGPDGSYDNHDTDGLGSIDLTEGGQSNGLFFTFSDVPQTFITISVSLRQTGYATVLASTAFVRAEEPLFLPFTDFQVVDEDPLDNDPLAPVDFTNVGYIHLEMNIIAENDTFTLDSIKTGFIPEPNSLLLIGLGGFFIRKKI